MAGYRKSTIFLTRTFLICPTPYLPHRPHSSRENTLAAVAVMATAEVAPARLRIRTCAPVLVRNPTRLEELSPGKARAVEGRSCTCRGTCATCRSTGATSRHLGELRSPPDGRKLLTSDRIPADVEVETKERVAGEKEEENIGDEKTEFFCGRGRKKTRFVLRYEPRGRAVGMLTVA